MPTRPPIFIISGKNPNAITGGYASYTGSLYRQLIKLHHPVTLVTLPLNPLGMIALFPFSLFLLPQLLFSTSPQSLIWGIGPWTLAGALLKLLRPHTILIADYFTSIDHEFSAAKTEVARHPYPSWLKLETWLAAIILIPTYNLLEKFLLLKADFIVTHYHSTEIILNRQFHINFNRFIRLPC